MDKKLIEMWLRRAEKIDVIDIPKEKIREVDFNEFKDRIGTIYEFEGSLYSRSQENPIIWLKMEIPSIEEETSDINKMKEVFSQLITLNNKLKSYIDKKIANLKKEQEEFFLELKEYVDNNIKVGWCNGNTEAP